MPSPDDIARGRELELTRALLRQARADRDRLQDAVAVTGDRVLELDDIARRAIQRAEAAEQELRETRRTLREAQQELLRATRVRRRLRREADRLARRLPGRAVGGLQAADTAARVELRLPGPEPEGQTPEPASRSSQPARPEPASANSPPTWRDLSEVVCLDVTTLRDPARSGIARVTIRLAQELARITTVRLVTITGDRLVRDPAFDEEVFGRAATPRSPSASPRSSSGVEGAPSASPRSPSASPRSSSGVEGPATAAPAPDVDVPGATVRGGPGVWVFSAAIQREAEFPAWQSEIARIRAEGGRYAQVVHDLLPIQLPDFFDLRMRRRFPQWLAFAVTNADVLFADSRATLEDLVGWTERRGLAVPHVQVLALGADPQDRPTADADQDARPLLLMVGVVEPRKSVDVVLDALTTLRDSGNDVALVIVGRRGWAAAGLIERLERLHAETDWFTWEERADDAALAAWYRRSHLLVAASRGEGYGLPLAEALASGLPVLARDLPVFREIVGADGRYFELDADLPQAILTALAQPRPPGRDLPTWRDTAIAVIDALGLGAPASAPDGIGNSAR